MKKNTCYDIDDAEQDGKSLNKPLGLMERCDKDRKYSKLELIYKKL